MDRLQKKCLVASAGVHSLLGLILLIGPAFLAEKEKPVEDVELLDLVDARLIDEAFSGGGNPNAARAPIITPPKEVTPPVQLPPEPQPKPQENQTQTPEPKQPDPVENKRNPEALEAESDKKPKTLEFKAVTRKNSSKTSSETAAQKQAREQAAARQKLAGQFAAAARSLNPSSSTAIEAYGPGGGGEVYMNYDQFVRSVYFNAWNPPDDTASDDAVTRATITIASNGDVTFRRITKPSGDAAVDASVDRTLKRVTEVAPFPKGSKDKERTYNINFNLKAKRLAG
jgi:TonB family protein